MKKLIFASLAILSLAAGYAQSGDDKNLQSRKVSGFQGIQVSGGIDLYLSSGPESVAVSASSTEIRDHIITEVINGNLRIHLEQNYHTYLQNPKMKAYVSISNLKDLDASGGSDVYIQNQINGTDIEIRLSGGSDLKGKLNANHLVINQSGGSDVNLSGNVKNLEVDASGGSDLGGYDLVTDYASVHASGGCDSHLTVNKELRIVASGGSDVSYKGTGSVKEVNSSGSSSVTRKD
jgi:Putative auto-transporter adhesin, head GIN domain